MKHLFDMFGAFGLWLASHRMSPGKVTVIIAVEGHNEVHHLVQEFLRDATPEKMTVANRQQLLDNPMGPHKIMGITFEFRQAQTLPPAKLL
jgi:hypothetical protein